VTASTQAFRKIQYSAFTTLAHSITLGVGAPSSIRDFHGTSPVSVDGDDFTDVNYRMEFRFEQFAWSGGQTSHFVAVCGEFAPYPNSLLTPVLWETVMVQCCTVMKPIPSSEGDGLPKDRVRPNVATCVAIWFFSYHQR